MRAYRSPRVDEHRVFELLLTRRRRVLQRLDLVAQVAPPSSAAERVRLAGGALWLPASLAAERGRLGAIGACCADSTNDSSLDEGSRGG